MHYRLVVEAQHDVGLDGPLDEADLVQSFSVKILASSEDGESEVVAGSGSFDLIKLGVAIDHGISAFEAMDTVDQELHELGAAVLDFETGQLRQDISDQVEYLGGDLMVLHAIEVEPEHRGLDLALVVADRLIDLYASGLIVCRPQGHDATATAKLRAELARIGFEPIEGGEFLVLGTTSDRPRVSLVRAGDN